MIATEVLFVLYIIRMVLRFFVQYYGHVIGVKMQAQMRRDLFVKLQKLPYSYYDNHETGKIMSRMTNDLMDVSELAHHGPENFFICGVMVIGSFIYLCTINVMLTLIVFACVPLLVLVAVIMRKRMREAFTESRKSIATINRPCKPGRCGSAPPGGPGGGSAHPGCHPGARRFPACAPASCPPLPCGP